MKLACAILSTLAGAGMTLMMLVLLLASTPNSTPMQLRQIEQWMLMVALIGAAAIAGALWAMITRRHGLAAGIGIAPVVLDIALLDAIA